MPFNTIIEAHLFACSPEGREEIAEEAAGSFLVNSWSRTQDAFCTMRAAILAELSNIDVHDLEEAVSRMSVNGVRFSGCDEEHFAATARLDNDYLHVGKGGSLSLLNGKVDFTEEEAFGAPIDFIRPGYF